MVLLPEVILNHLFEFLPDLLIPVVRNNRLSYCFHPTYLSQWIHKVLHPSLLFRLSFPPHNTEKTVFYKGLPLFNQVFWTYSLPIPPGNHRMMYEYSVPSTDANPSTFVWHTRTVLGPVDEFPQHTLQGGMVYCDGTSYPIYRVHRFHTGYEHVLVVEPRMTRLFEHTPFPHHLINALHPMLLEESDMAYLFGFPI